MEKNKVSTILPPYQMTSEINFTGKEKKREKKQGFKGIRQWLIKRCKSQMKIRLQLFDTQLMNKISC